MHEITVSNRHHFPCPDNYIYLAEAPETIQITFQHNTETHGIEITDLKFYSPEFLHNSLRDKMIEDYQGIDLSQFQFFRFNRNAFFPLTDDFKFKYICIDAACQIARNYANLLNNNPAVFYIYDKTESSITALIKNDGAYESIGFLKVVETDDELIWLDCIEVDQDHQRKGIATTLLKLAVGHLYLNAVPCVKEAKEYRFYLTDEGEKFIVDSLMKDIIHCEMCYFSTVSNYRSSRYILLRPKAQYDPGFDSEILMQLNVANPQHESATNSIRLS